LWFRLTSIWCTGQIVYLVVCGRGQIENGRPNAQQIRAAYTGAHWARKHDMGDGTWYKEHKYVFYRIAPNRAP